MACALARWTLTEGSGCGLIGASPQIGDPVRVKVAGVEVEGRIEAFESSALHVRIGRRLL